MTDNQNQSKLKVEAKEPKGGILNWVKRHPWLSATIAAVPLYIAAQTYIGSIGRSEEERPRPVSRTSVPSIRTDAVRVAERPEERPEPVRPARPARPVSPSAPVRPRSPRVTAKPIWTYSETEVPKGHPVGTEYSIDEVNPDLHYVTGSNGKLYVAGMPLPLGVMAASSVRKGSQAVADYKAEQEALKRAKEAEEKAKLSALERKTARMARMQDLYEKMSAIEKAMADRTSDPEPIVLDPATPEPKDELGDIVVTISKKLADDYKLTVPDGINRLYVRKTPEKLKKEKKFGDYYMQVVYGDGKIESAELGAGDLKKIEEKLGFDL
jgi:hypothetical protein